MVRHLRKARPQLITDAPMGPEVEYEYRRKRYAIMMSGRVLCVILAACIYRVSAALAVLLVVGGGVLPWTAVIMANDRLSPKKVQSLHQRLPDTDRALPAVDQDRVIEAEYVSDTETSGRWVGPEAGDVPRDEHPAA